MIEYFFAVIGAITTIYLVIFYEQLANRAGIPITLDLVIAVVGITLLLEATRRSLGWVLALIATIFLAYSALGAYMPDIIAHKGASLEKIVSHQWLSSEGVFGVALGVSTSFVFLFVLFGALLEKAGGGQYFIQVSFSLLGHMKGGPAKAAVIASGLSGLVSGSSISNVVTTGTFTIPMMKKNGFPAYKAGAIEVAASTNGQLTPPVMGAAAFLMVEYVGISYIEVIKHALLPALLSYIALLYIVHLEACKMGLKATPKIHTSSWLDRIMMTIGSFLMLMLLAAVLYYGLGWIKEIFGERSYFIIGGLVLITYILLLKMASSIEIAEIELSKLPKLRTVISSGLYFILPVVILVWNLIIERFSPELSVFWAIMVMIIILLTHKPILAIFRKQHIKSAIKTGINDLFCSFIIGSRNMISIGIATATAGIIVGTVTLTGVGLMMTEVVEFISGGHLILILFFTAVMSLILGMGLPTTANYIIVSTLMVPVIQTLGSQHGLVVPVIALHLFVFYFGILADDTPPVGLAAFAASAIAQSSPIKTGIQGFMYDIRTAILPFMFIFNTELLLIGIESWMHLMSTIIFSIIAILTFAAATQRYWFTHNRWWETFALILIAFSFFRPDFWWDRIYPPTIKIPPQEISHIIETMPPNKSIILHAKGETLEGKEVEKNIYLPVSDGKDSNQRLINSGISFYQKDNKLLVEQVEFGSPAYKAGFDLDWEITGIIQKQNRPPKQLVYIPTFILLIIIMFLQLRRKKNLKQG